MRTYHAGPTCEQDMLPPQPAPIRRSVHLRAVPDETGETVLYPVPFSLFRVRKTRTHPPTPDLFAERTSGNQSKVNGEMDPDGRTSTPTTTSWWQQLTSSLHLTAQRPPPKRFTTRLRTLLTKSRGTPAPASASHSIAPSPPPCNGRRGWKIRPSRTKLYTD